MIGRVDATPDCPACASPRTQKRVAMRVPLRGGAAVRTHIHRCRACGHHFLRTTEDEQRAVESIYGHDYHGYHPDPVFARRVREELDACIAPRKPPPARVLDVGCGNGEFLLAAAERGYQAEGLDVSEAAAELCRDRGLAARAGDFLTTDLGGGFDILTMWDVVEHLRMPRDFLRRARELLNPGGVLVLKIPGFGALCFPPIAVYPRIANIVLGAPAHVQYFNSGSLGALLAATGFTSVEWLRSQGFRSPAVGGSLKKRIGRAMGRAISAVARNRTLFVAASR